MFLSNVRAASMLFICQGTQIFRLRVVILFGKLEVSQKFQGGKAAEKQADMGRFISWRDLCSPLRFLGRLAAGATVIINYTASEPSMCISCCPDKIFLAQYLQRLKRQHVTVKRDIKYHLTSSFYYIRWSLLRHFSWLNYSLPNGGCGYQTGDTKYPMW